MFQLSLNDNCFSFLLYWHSLLCFSAFVFLPLLYFHFSSRFAIRIRISCSFQSFSSLTLCVLSSCSIFIHLFIHSCIYIHFCKYNLLQRISFSKLFTSSVPCYKSSRNLTREQTDGLCQRSSMITMTQSFKVHDNVAHSRTIRVYGPSSFVAFRLPMYGKIRDLFKRKIQNWPVHALKEFPKIRGSETTCRKRERKQQSPVGEVKLRKITSPNYSKEGWLRAK